MTPLLDFTSEAFFRDPPRAIAALRGQGPVVATRFPLVGDVWITTTHDATAQVLKDGATFTLRKEGGGVAGIRWWMPKLVTTIAKLEKLKRRPEHNTPSKPGPTRHRVELSILPANSAPQTAPKVIELTATSLVASHEPG